MYYNTEDKSSHKDTKKRSQINVDNPITREIFKQELLTEIEAENKGIGISLDV